MNLTNIIAKRERKTLYRDGDKRIKVFDEGYPKADIFNEVLNQVRVEELDLNVPKILEVTLYNGCWVIVSEFIEGKTLAELTEENPGKTKEYIDLMVDLQIKVHAQKCPLLTNLRDKMARKISLTDYSYPTKYDLQTRLSGLPRHDKVCHGDFRTSNIILAPDGTPFIIDWAHVTQGNASADVARTYLLYLLADQKENGEYYMDKFCEKTDTARHYVERWIPIVAASQSVKGNQHELAFLHRIVDVFEYE